MPELAIIAGPNGAGKSTTSHDILLDIGIESFDFDLEFYSSWAKFGYDPAIENGIRESVGQLFEERKHQAISSQSSFSFETNYNSTEIINTINEFKRADFYTELVFIMLKTPEIAIERVKDRVLKGGHSVDENTIRARFYDGLELLDSTFTLFDSVGIYLSQTNVIIDSLLIEPENKIVELFNPIPESVVLHLPKLKLYLEELDRSLS